MAQSSRFWDFFAKRYAKSPVGNEAAYQRKLETTRKYMTPDMEVLEFGCGPGTTAITQSAHVRHILAIDFSDKMLAIARDRADAAGVTNVTFQRARIEEFDQSDASYAMVMGHSVLHLLEDREPVIAKVFALLKPGGVFVSSTTCASALPWILRTVLKVGNNVGVLPLLRFFSIDELITSIQNAGFSIDHKWLPGGSDAVFIVAKKPS